MNYSTNKFSEYSPLYDYWNSQQEVQDLEKMLILCSKDINSSSLVRKEPYKWEVFFQFTIRQIYQENKYSIKIFYILINMLSNKETIRIIKKIKESPLFSDEIKQSLNDKLNLSNPNFISRCIRPLYIIFILYCNIYLIPLNNVYKKPYLITAKLVLQFSRIFKLLT